MKGRDGLIYQALVQVAYDRKMSGDKKYSSSLGSLARFYLFEFAQAAGRLQAIEKLDRRRQAEAVRLIGLGPY